MLNIIFSNGLSSNIDISRENANKQIDQICNDKSEWFTLYTGNSSFTYNKSLIAIMESK